MVRSVMLVVLGGVVVTILGWLLLAGTFAGAMWGAREVAAERLDAPRITDTSSTRPRSYREERRLLGRHLGKVDGITVVDHAVDPRSHKTRFRFEATPQQIAAITRRLNLVPYPLRSKVDHGFWRDRNDPDWWQPDREMTCCTLYRGRDDGGKSMLVLVYNSDGNLAYAEIDEPPASH